MAAGKGTRMKSDLPKVLHSVAGRTLVEHVVGTAHRIGAQRIVVIVGHGRELVCNVLQNAGVEFAVQDPPLGTGHAVMQAQSALNDFGGEVIVLSGDVPLLTAETLQRLLADHRTSHSAATVLTANAPDPNGYGRIVRESSGEFTEIVEEHEATPEIRNIHEINSGVYCFDSKRLFEGLQDIRDNNSKGEYYLTDVIGIMRNRGHLVKAVSIADFREIQGINTQDELKAAEAELLSR
jgi:UDP-N-acetylglucosamine diphosphorylase/glucosamine-1-phosphate N-acetyltransferase